MGNKDDDWFLGFIASSTAILLLLGRGWVMSTPAWLQIILWTVVIIGGITTFLMGIGKLVYRIRRCLTLKSFWFETSKKTSDSNIKLSKSLVIEEETSEIRFRVCTGYQFTLDTFSIHLKDQEPMGVPPAILKVIDTRLENSQSKYAEIISAFDHLGTSSFYGRYRQPIPFSEGDSIHQTVFIKTNGPWKGYLSFKTKDKELVNRTIRGELTVLPKNK